MTCSTGSPPRTSDREPEEAAGEEFPHLGLTLAPAHTTIEIRRAVGLPEVIGLLVRAVEPGSRAAQAGIRTGDVLVRTEHGALRSVTALYGAINAARAAGALRVWAVRGVDAEAQAVLDLGPRSRDEAPPGRTVPAGEAATHTV